ncbi:MAG: glycosyltransferase family 4 protein [Bacteroidia bacterium]|nr:glycosyltransferase family 4 protein [Bacteroidia bacterium]
MNFTLKHPAIYAAFDAFPTAKGASTHIFHFSQALFNLMSGGGLYTLAPQDALDYQFEDGVEMIRFNQPIANFLERSHAFGCQFYDLLANQVDIRLIHFRDPWSGIPSLLHRQRRAPQCQIIYEVNGLPSIELPYRYPHLSVRTLQKIRGLENYCLHQADHILCPAHTIRQHLVGRGIADNKIRVIANGAEIAVATPDAAPMAEPYLIYFGALQPWQGLDVLLKAFSYLLDYKDLRLVICASHRERYSKPYRRLAEKLGIDDRIIWHFQLGKETLYHWVRHAFASVAPLQECQRNLEQGCAPLKILESMALATPVVASDIPAVREILPPEQGGLLTRANRPPELARTIRILLEHPAYARQLGEQGAQRIQEYFSWDQKKHELQNFYRKILS